MRMNRALAVCLEVLVTTICLSREFVFRIRSLTGCHMSVVICHRPVQMFAQSRDVSLRDAPISIHPTGEDGQVRVCHEYVRAVYPI